ncbi:MAG: hypothetical protein AAFV49_16910, partial [Pseudomonadota bacterium]
MGGSVTRPSPGRRADAPAPQPEPAARETLPLGPGDRVGVMLPMPFEGPLDYRVAEGASLVPGSFVSVALGSRRPAGARMRRR